LGFGNNLGLGNINLAAAGINNYGLSSLGALSGISNLNVLGLNNLSGMQIAGLQANLSALNPSLFSL
jgi:hypothetical protein